MKILVVNGYSENTIKVYPSIISLAEVYFKKALGDVSESELEEFFYYMVHTKGASYAYQKQIAMALKLYYRELYGRSVKLELLMPQNRLAKLPVILSFEEIEVLLSVLSNIKHRCMVALIYSAGLRIGEMIRMRVKDIDLDHMMIHIKKRNGENERVVPLSERVLETLRKYYEQYSPKDFLFEGQTGDSYSASTFNKILRKAGQRAKIKKGFSSHALRHSYAAHLLEKGIDMKVIQKLLGHSSIKTTMLYKQVASTILLHVKSPFDY